MLNELRVTLPPEVPVEEAGLLLTIKLFETGRLSLGQAVPPVHAFRTRA